VKGKPKEKTGYHLDRSPCLHSVGHSYLTRSSLCLVTGFWAGCDDTSNPAAVGSFKRTFTVKLVQTFLSVSLTFGAKMAKKIQSCLQNAPFHNLISWDFGRNVGWVNGYVAKIPRGFLLSLQAGSLMVKLSLCLMKYHVMKKQSLL